MQLVQAVAEIRERSRFLRIDIRRETLEETKDFIKAENARKKSLSEKQSRKKNVMLIYLTT